MTNRNNYIQSIIKNNLVRLSKDNRTNPAISL